MGPAGNLTNFPAPKEPSVLWVISLVINPRRHHLTSRKMSARGRHDPEMLRSPVPITLRWLLVAFLTITGGANMNRITLATSGYRGKIIISLST